MVCGDIETNTVIFRYSTLIVKNKVKKREKERGEGGKKLNAMEKKRKGEKGGKQTKWGIMMKKVEKIKILGGKMEKRR